MSSSDTTSSNPLAYVGTDHFNQPRFNRAGRAPTSNDKLIAGTQWLDKTTSIIYISKDDGVWDQVGSAGGAINNIQFQTFTASGIYTPTSGMKFCIMKVIGAGGAGGGRVHCGPIAASAGAGGGSGSYAEILFTAAEIGDSKVVTIGVGGVGVVGPEGKGTDGSSTSIGALATLGGGLAGNAGVLNTTEGGSAIGGDGGSVNTITGTTIYSVDGAPGGNSSYAGSADYAASGAGGDSQFGYSTPGVATIGGTHNPNDSTSFGTGGSGASGTNNSYQSKGAYGANGYLQIMEYIYG